ADRGNGDGAPGLPAADAGGPGEGHSRGGPLDRRQARRDWRATRWRSGGRAVEEMRGRDRPACPRISRLRADDSGALGIGVPQARPEGAVPGAGHLAAVKAPGAGLTAPLYPPPIFRTAAPRNRPNRRSASATFAFSRG